MSSFVTSLLLNIFLLFNNYRWEIGCYTKPNPNHYSNKVTNPATNGHIHAQHNEPTVNRTETIHHQTITAQTTSYKPTKLVSSKTNNKTNIHSHHRIQKHSKRVELFFFLVKLFRSSFFWFTLCC